ncbi:MAG: endonuclease NucS [Chloroflexi bacterium]|nr:endonuclease NucS [Chloroflexota bacterium]
MASDPQLFRVNPDSQKPLPLEEVEFAALGFRERQDIQEWVAANPNILGDDLLVIAKEFSGFDRTNERLDLLAVDYTGALVIIELKRDDSGEDVHWQAIKYASYLRSASEVDIVRMLANYAEVSEEEAAEQLRTHLGAEELTGLNHGQRIILASHRFAPEVTSAALWLNERVSEEDLITCVTLTPFRDPETQALYVQANPIIPVPTASQFLIGVGNGVVTQSSARTSLSEKLSRRFRQNSSDDITRFCWKVAELVLENLPQEVCPDKKSRWANGWEHHRYFNFWYSRPPWSNYYLCHSFHMQPKEDSGQYLVAVSFNSGGGLVEQAVVRAAESAGLSLERDGNSHAFTMAKRESALDDGCAGWAAGELRRAITIITPVVDALPEEGNEAEV